MMQEPKKPKNYIRDQVIIVLLAVAVFFIVMKIISSPYAIVPAALLFYQITDGIWFKEYNSKKSEYQERLDREAAADREKARVNSLYSENSKVNENIAKYKQLQQEKRAKAKWWQFWI
ncbi:hypothetical protein [Brumicola blandensis]|uniref:Uncharacterized protein n=1 Tax=Brumicola blandensis TaxID=3075611 RepID=A0AAW8R0H7_9ALTE|nr:hypothetical protein [Alteromonas sp. W409]MDT0581706.1 hypothetical protein [Alteromonas sp. W409]